MQTIKTYILKNQYLEVHVLNYGGIIDKIYCADKDGIYENVVLSYQKQEDYIQVPGPYLNALVGPTAGRIAGGKYRDSQLTLNDGANHLHGGKHGISFDFFEIEQISDKQLIARLEKNHDEDGYHGFYTYEVTYTLQDNALVLSYNAHVSEPGLLYMTSHLYFNLSGGLKRTILDESLKANFKQMIYLDETCAPSQIVNIEKGSTFDFSQGKLIGEAINDSHPQYAYTKGIDHPFFVAGDIVLCDEMTKRRLTIHSDSPCAVIYSGNYLDDSIDFENGVKGCKHLGVAIELQDYPNGIQLGLSQERCHYTQKTIYSFDIKK